MDTNIKVGATDWWNKFYLLSFWTLSLVMRVVAPNSTIWIGTFTSSKLYTFKSCYIIHSDVIRKDAKDIV